MKKIKILHANIQGQPAFTEFNLNESDLMFAKAKKMICEKIKTLPSDEIVFYSISKNSMVKEIDKVGKYTIGQDGAEFELYLISDLLKTFLNQKLPIGSVQFQANNSQNFDDELNKMKEKYKKIDEENKKLQAESLIQMQNYENKIIILSKEKGSLKNEIKSLKQSHEDKIQIEDEQKQKILEQFKEEMNRVKQLQLEQIKLNSQIAELQFKIKENELDKKDQQTNIDQLNKTISYQKNQILNSQLGKQQIQTIEQKQQLLQEQFENQKEKQKSIQLQHEIEKLQLIIRSNQEEIQVIRSNAECQYKLYQRQVETIQDKCKILERKNQQTLSDKDVIRNEKRELLREHNELLTKLRLIEYEKKKAENLQNDLEIKLIQQNSVFETKIKNLEQHIDGLTKNNDQIQAQKQRYMADINRLNMELGKANQKIVELETQLDLERKKIIDLEKVINQLQEDLKNNKKEYNQNIERMMKELDNEGKRAEKEFQKKEQLAKRMKQNQIRKVAKVKFIGATQALITTMKNPFEFLKNENIMTDDIVANVEILQIDINKALEKLVQNWDPDLTDLVSFKSLGQWSLKKSIAPNGDGTKRSAYLVKVMECEHDIYKNQSFVIKELTGFQKLSSLENALYVAQNQLRAHVMTTYFKDKFTTIFNQKCPYSFNYPLPFIFKTDACFYVAEHLVEGQFRKFNGETDSEKINDGSAELFNAFSIFTYKATQNMLMITHIQGIQNNEKEYILCDPIISSPEGALGEEDLAENHILQFIDSVQRNPDSKCMKYLKQMKIDL